MNHYERRRKVIKKEHVNDKLKLNRVKHNKRLSNSDIQKMIDNAIYM